jgi:hypothetical protein
MYVGAQKGIEIIKILDAGNQINISHTLFLLIIPTKTYIANHSENTI